MNIMKALKTATVALVLAVVLGGSALVASLPSPQPAGATPAAMLGINSFNCIALGSAFGGLETTDAASDCLNIQQQFTADHGSIAHFVSCLRGSNVLNFEFTPPTLAHECVSAADLGRPDCPATEVAKCGPIIPKDLAPLDLDKNQVYYGQDLIVFAFVNDDSPVRFITDKGTLVDFKAVQHGREWFCQTALENTIPSGDPDCDGTSATKGDGVVVGRVRILASDTTGTGTVTAIQEGVGYPMTFTVTGRPETISVTPLFGKDTIQTGATAPPKKSEVTTVAPRPTDCSFAATAAAVLGAIDNPVLAILVVKAKDNDGIDTVGTLLDWDHPFVAATSAPFKIPQPQGGVALPLTPTIDTGPLGVSFPQFVCGGKETGDMVLRVSFSNALDGLSVPCESLTTCHDALHVNVTVHVVGPTAKVALAADPPVVDCNGTATSKVTATLTTADGKPVANGVDVKFGVSVLGTANPIVGNSGGGTASTVVKPLSGANDVSSPGPKGVPVIVTAGDVAASILVQCSGATVAPAGGGGAAPGGGTAPAASSPGRISGPDTGSGGFAGSSGPLSWWPALGLAAAAFALLGVRFATKRSE
jgi:hypothetical protein